MKSSGVGSPGSRATHRFGAFTRLAAVIVVVCSALIAAATVEPGAARAAEAVDPGAALRAVSCTSASFCVATDDQGKALSYNGSSWSSPDNIDGSALLTSVSCLSGPTFCQAVDDEGNVLTFNGSSWSGPDNIDGSSTLASVSCVTSSFCVATDDQGNAFTYTGSSWSGPNNIDGSALLTSVSCPTSSFCEAVDIHGNSFTDNSGTWTSAFDLDGSNDLTSVSCATSSFCAAVDDIGNAFIYSAGTWMSPTDIDSSGLTSVSCVTTTFCVAVDDQGNALDYNVTATWSQPLTIDGSNILESVSCPTTSYCAAADADGNAVTYGLGLVDYSCNTGLYGTFSIPALITETPAAPATIEGSGTFQMDPGIVFSLPPAIVTDSEDAGVTQLTYDSGSATINQDGGSAFTASEQTAGASNLPQTVDLLTDPTAQEDFTFNPITWTAGASSGSADFQPGPASFAITTNSPAIGTIMSNCTPTGSVPILATTTVTAPSGTPSVNVPNEVVPSSSTVTAGYEALWPISISNTSSVEVTGITLTAAAVAGSATPLAFDSAKMAKSDAGSSCAPSGAPDDHVTCALGSLAPSVTTTIYALVETTATLANGTNVSGTIDVTSNGPEAVGSLGTVMVVVQANQVSAAAAPGVKLLNTSAALSPSNPVKIKFKLPKKVLRSSLPSNSQRSSAAIAKPRRHGRHRSTNQSPSRAVRQSTTVSAPPTAVVLGGLKPTSDYLLCPTNTSCVGTLAQVSGNFGNYMDATHPIAASLEFLLGSPNPSARLWIDGGTGHAAQVGSCVKSGSTYTNLPCYTKAKTSGRAPNATVTYSVDFVSNDPIFGVRG